MLFNERLTALRDRVQRARITIISRPRSAAQFGG